MQDYFWLSLIVTATVILLSITLFHKLVLQNRAIQQIPTQIPLNISPHTDPVGEYEVFLSFRGLDTRKGFTDFLYTYLVGAGIRTFRDDNELRVGEEIGPDLLKAINNSKISIPIFSRNYAYSKWCLRELAQMVECQANGGQKIFPIFYDVDPSDVQHQNGKYEKAFRQHMKKLDGKIVQKWKEAMGVVGELKGLELKKETNGCEGELVKMVVEKVLFDLKKNYTHVPDNLVGMEHHEEQMMRLLNIGFSGIRIVGVHGMGGIGKTTITKVVYNKLIEHFDFCCFLDDVREKSRHHNGLVDLQNQLVSKISRGIFSTIVDVEEGIKKIKDIVNGKKVIVVLDDIDEKFQFDKLVGNCEWFGLGSRIIVTTRNKDVLDSIKVIYQKHGLPEAYKEYEPELMDYNHSLQLFCKYAFMRDFPIEGYGIISKQFVSTAAGLPLVLVTMGSLLFGKEDMDLWIEILRKLEKIPHDKVMGKLRISFEALEYEQKQIFLDIACLFIGEEKTNPFYMWDDCEFYPRNGMNILVLRSLVKVGEDNRLWMHDHLRDLGRQIVREENPNEPEERSRLWHREEALDVLERRMGTKKVVALRLDFIRRGRNSESHRLVAEQFWQLPNLRFLRVDNADLDGDFKYLLSNLRWLQSRRCSGNFTPANCRLKNLVILDLSYSNITNEWMGWTEIKMAKKLKALNVSRCYNLTKVPYMSTFASLESLDICLCPDLSDLDGIEKLASLRYLNASHCKSIKVLPDLSKLKTLKVLNISHCTGLTRSPQLSMFTSLENLDIQFCPGILRLDGLECLESLIYLNSSSCGSLEMLPNLSKLRKLKRLDIKRCSKLIEIQGVDKLESLEHLDMNGCKSLERLPDLSNLRKLKALDTSWCEKVREIQGLDRLESLERLEMRNCVSLESLPCLSNLKKLKELMISRCIKLIEIPGLDKLAFFKHLDLNGCTSIERLPTFMNLKMLKTLNLFYCKKLPDVEGLWDLESLEQLDISNCENLGKKLNLSKLKNLKKLWIRGLSDLTEIPGFEELKQLEVFDTTGCRSIVKLPDLSNFKNLKEIRVCYCVKLTEIRGLEELRSLTILETDACESLKDLPNLPNIRKSEKSNLFINDFLKRRRNKLQQSKDQHQDLSENSAL